MVRQEYSITLGEVDKVLVALDEREGEILRLGSSLDREGSRTLVEVGGHFNLTGGRTCQTKAHAGAGCPVPLETGRTAQRSQMARKNPGITSKKSGSGGGVAEMVAQGGSRGPVSSTAPRRRIADGGKTRIRAEKGLSAPHRRLSRPASGRLKAALISTWPGRPTSGAVSKTTSSGGSFVSA